VEVRVEEALEHRLGDVLRRHVRVVPSFDDEVDGVLDDDLGNFSGGLVENEGKMVLRLVRSG
jgi:hypothetical protein